MGSGGASKADLKREAQQRESEAKAAIKAEKDARVLRNAQAAQRKREEEAQRWQARLTLTLTLTLTPHPTPSL